MQLFHPKDEKVYLKIYFYLKWVMLIFWVFGIEENMYYRGKAKIKASELCQHFVSHFQI
jgi:hypothetical protein